MHWRIPFLLLAITNLLLGFWLGLTRIGWSLPGSEMAVHHGAIMVGGFLTTLISLEKVIPLRNRSLFIVPVASALTIVMLIPGWFPVGLSFSLAGSVGLLVVQGYYLYKYPRDLSTALMWVGAGCLVMGNAMLIQSRFYPAAFPWWMCFVLFTISGERLELSKFLPVSRGQKTLLVVLLTIFLVGVIIPFHSFGKYVSGIAMLGVAIWMLRHDVIFIGLKKDGLTRFSAVGLLAANVWLLLEGLFLVMLPDGAFSYDLLVHSFFIGYTFSMIFAHGPIILPGILGLVMKPYHYVLYVWLLLAQASLLLRIAADAFVLIEARRISGILSAISILFFLITTAVLMVRGSRAVKH